MLLDCSNSHPSCHNSENSNQRSGRDKKIVKVTAGIQLRRERLSILLPLKAQNSLKAVRPPLLEEVACYSERLTFLNLDQSHPEGCACRYREDLARDCSCLPDHYCRVHRLRSCYLQMQLPKLGQTQLRVPLLALSLSAGGGAASRWLK